MISLVLGGGAIRGFYHVGVIKALQDLDIQVDEVIGCSVGSVIGAIYAANPDVDLDRLLEEVSRRKLIEPIINRAAMLDTKALAEFLNRATGVTEFSELKIPLTLISTDMNTGEEVHLTEGTLTEAVLASLAVPSVFKPVEIGERLLCDGGIVNNVPINVAKGDNIIVSDINLPLMKVKSSSWKRHLTINTFLIMLRSNALKGQKWAEEQGKQMIYLILDKPINPIDLRKSQRTKLIKQGYEDTVKKSKLILQTSDR